MLIIGVVALLVIGPERLPGVARQAGKYIGRIKRFVASVRSDVEREFRTDELQRMLRQQQDELQSLKQAVNETRQEVDLESIEKSVGETIEEAVKDTPDQPQATKQTEQKNAANSAEGP